PAIRTRPARSTLPSASDTVGLDSPETRASSAREQGPRWRMCSRSSCSFMARISDGRGANNPALTFSGGGSASAGGCDAAPDGSAAVGCGPGARCGAVDAPAVTATSSNGVAARPRPECYGYGGCKVTTSGQFSGALVPDEIVRILS